jgi:hypothetical protein
MKKPKQYDLEYWFSKIELQLRDKDATRTPGPPSAM